MVSPFKKRHKPKPKPKPVIDYPPVPTRTWVPPDDRPKKARPAPYKPAGVTQKLAISSLKKVWHNFLIYGERAVLSGTVSQAHKRYSYRSCGYQGPCNCVMAIAYSKLFEMTLWTRVMLDKILDLGDKLYIESCTLIADKSRKEIRLVEVYHTFFVDRIKVTTDMKGKRSNGKLLADFDDSPYLKQVLPDFFAQNESGILVVQKRYFAIWTSGNAFYLFDPTEHNDRGFPWSGISGAGFCLLARLPTSNHLADLVRENFDKAANPKFVLVPCTIIRKLQVTTKYPDCLENANLETRPVPSKVTAASAKQDSKLRGSKLPVVGSKVPVVGSKVKIEAVSDASIILVGDVDEGEVPPEGAAAPPKKIQARFGVKDPIEKVKTKSITYFQELLPTKVGILRGMTHQCDPNFSKYLGKQSLTNATAAIAMLRKFRSKHWTSFVVDEILRLGEVIYHDSMKALTGDQILKVTTVAKTVSLYESLYSPEIEEFSAVGKLGSLKSDVLDLPAALKIFLSDNQACIVCGPLVLAVWVEHQYYYMFDPNERDPNGVALTRQMTIGSFQKVFDVEPGFACVTWFRNLQDLVDLYMRNVPRANRRDRFTLSKIQIKDYVELPKAWNNFQALAKAKWILRGSFSQNNARYARETRNTQCTANAAMSIIMNALVPLMAWTGDTLDEILDKGDAFYAACVAALKSKNKYQSALLMADELLKTYQMDGDKEINLEIDDCLVNGNLSFPDDATDFPNLKVGFRQFFSDSDAGIVTCRLLSMAVWKLEERYYYFDSHSRDENGISVYYGTSCVIRTETVEELTDAVLANLGAGIDSMYNISRVVVKVYDASEGVAKPPLNNYTAVNDDTSILRGPVSQASPDFGVNAGKQTLPNNLVAIGMKQVYPSCDWTEDIMREVLVLGDKLYAESMEAFMRDDGRVAVAEKVPDEAAETDQPVEETAAQDDEVVEDSDDITSQNVVRQYTIGVNDLTVEFGDAQEGRLADLEEALNAVYVVEDDSDEADNKEMLLESGVLTVALWKEGGLYYVYDPQPRDAEGQVFGKDEWTTVPSTREDEEEEGDEEDEEAVKNADEAASRTEASPTTSTEVVKESLEEIIEKEMELYGGGEEEESYEKPPALPKHSSHFWREQAMIDGRACVMWFTKPEYMIGHVIDNTPPMKGEEPFKLIPIKITNRPAAKKTFDAESGVAPPDDVAGDWFEFKEVDYGRWILRGSMDQTNELFPAPNRGRQSVANCFSAVAFGRLYALNRYKARTVDHILMYGDRLFTFTRNARKKELADNKDLALTDDEIDMILSDETYGVDETAKHFCLGEDKVQLTVENHYVMGEINSKNGAREPPDLSRGLKLYFAHNSFGVLECKGLAVAIWSAKRYYYMFDPNSRGPSGLNCVNGVACLTRYKCAEDLVKVFLTNLPKDGKNDFYVHKVCLDADSCPREEVRKPKAKPVKELPVTSFVPIVPGKSLVRGNLSQEHPMFARANNVQFAPIALVALAMSLVHKCFYWTKPIVDEIVIIGDKLYSVALERLGFDFNPWEQKMTLDLAPTDFKVGTLKASCQLRPYDESGTLTNTKDPQVLNLRQGLDRFFEENSHGVIETDRLVLAVWEETEPKRTVYVFDANPRGPTGMPLMGGCACVLSFDSTKLVADHFVSLVPDCLEDRFKITPVEVCVGKSKTKTRKKKKAPDCDGAEARALVAPKLKPLSPSEKKKLRERELELKRKLEAQRRDRLGRKEFYNIPGTDLWILRGYRSLYSKQYNVNSRGFQDIPVCLTSYVMERLYPFAKWSAKFVDMVVDVGDQLYKDSYVAYNPSNKKLGLCAVVRDIIIKDVQVHIAIGKPVFINHFDVAYLEKALEMFFRQKQFCMISVNEKYVSIFFEDDLYYVFDPHGIDLNADRAAGGEAALIRCEKLGVLCEKVVNNYKLDEETADVFSIIMVSIKSIKKLPIPQK